MLTDPRGLDADQEREDQKDAQKWRGHREKERRDAEEQELRNRVIEDPKGPRFGPQSPSQGTSKNESNTDIYLCCLSPRCEFRTKRRVDLERHLNMHYPTRPGQLLDCPGRGCSRVGENGFRRKDHLTEHLRKVHAMRIRYRIS